MDTSNPNEKICAGPVWKDVKMIKTKVSIFTAKKRYGPGNLGWCQIQRFQWCSGHSECTRGYRYFWWEDYRRGWKKYSWVSDFVLCVEHLYLAKHLRGSHVYQIYHTLWYWYLRIFFRHTIVLCINGPRNSMTPTYSSFSPRHLFFFTNPPFHPPFYSSLSIYPLTPPFSLISSQSLSPSLRL